MDNMNLTNDTDGCDAAITPMEFRTFEKVIFFVLGVCLIVLILFGNCLTVVAVFKSEPLRTGSNLFIASLAFADITVALLVLPLSMVSELIQNMTIHWILCYIWISCDVMCCTASILHLCVISLDRYLIISAPFDAYKHMPIKRAVLIVSIVWLCSASISFVPIFAGWFQKKSHNHVTPDYGSGLINVTQCGLNDINRLYAVFSSAVSFFIPLLIMTLSYAKIFQIAKRHVNQMNDLMLQKGVRDSPEGKRRNRIRKQSMQMANDIKAVKTLGILMGLFILCWLPFFIMYLTLAFCPSCCVPKRLVISITWLGYINCFFNPFIYAYRNKDYRHAFQTLLKCRQKFQISLPVRSLTSD